MTAGPWRVSAYIRGYAVLDGRYEGAFGVILYGTIPWVLRRAYDRCAEIGVHGRADQWRIKVVRPKQVDTGEIIAHHIEVHIHRNARGDVWARQVHVE